MNCLADKVVITFNHREGGKTITPEDVTSSDMYLAGTPWHSRGCSCFSFCYSPLLAKLHQPSIGST